MAQRDPTYDEFLERVGDMQREGWRHSLARVRMNDFLVRHGDEPATLGLVRDVLDLLAEGAKR